MTKEKHDVFVGNLYYTITEEDIKQLFEKVGPVANVRIVVDKDTGRPRGFAFVEYYDAATALSAIRNLDGEDLNGRKIRVGYSNNSNLREIAKEMGQIVNDSSKSIESVIASIPLTEAYDALHAMKELIETDPAQAKVVLESYPQLIPAFIEVQKRLGMSVIGSDDEEEGTEDMSTSHQEYLLQQLLQMTDDDLMKLPPEGRTQMIRLREKLLKEAGESTA